MAEKQVAAGKPNLTLTDSVDEEDLEEEEEELDEADIKSESELSDFEIPHPPNQISDEKVYDLDFDSLPNGKFVSGMEAYIMIKRHDHVFTEFPVGPKSNVWFLVDNKENIERMSQNLRCLYFDDCGEWDPTKSKTHHCYYHVKDNFKVIFKKSDEYCMKVRRKKETFFVPIQPQPQEKDVVLMIRYSSTLKYDPTFRKHVTFFKSDENPYFGDVALYEYMGTNYGNMTTAKMQKRPKSMATMKEELEIKRKKKEYSENKMQLTEETKLESPIGDLPHGQFTTGFQAYDIVRRHHEVFEECPPGDKSDKWILVDNRDNLRRLGENQKRCFYDDCGSWNSKTSRVHRRFYLLRDNFKLVFKNEGIFYTKKLKKDKGKLNVPLNPQPDPNTVVEMYRYEINLASDPNFKKRVTYFIKPDEPGISEVALYEYMGTYKGLPPDSKLRTNPKVLEKMREEIHSKLPREIYKEILYEDPSIKSVKQVRNLKYRETHPVTPKPKKQVVKKEVKRASKKKSGLKEPEKKVFHIILDDFGM